MCFCVIGCDHGCLYVLRCEYVCSVVFRCASVWLCRCECMVAFVCVSASWCVGVLLCAHVRFVVITRALTLHHEFAMGCCFPFAISGYEFGNGFVEWNLEWISDVIKQSTPTVTHSTTQYTTTFTTQIHAVPAHGMEHAVPLCFCMLLCDSV